MYKQEIYYGAPGTGKSYEVSKLLKDVNSRKIFRVTIHPEYTYSDFIGQILPVLEQNGNTKFQFRPGPFTLALKETYSDNSKDVYLVLEELSRGNVAGIFGDIFQLLDRDNHFVSKYPIRNKNIADEIPTLLTDEIVLPSNFNILCTVNTNDQNVFPMDTAFKRRFDWMYISTKPARNDEGIVIKTLNNPQFNIRISNSEAKTVSWQDFYTSLNEYITDKNKGMGKNEDKQVGQFFIVFPENDIKDTYSDNSDISKPAINRVENIIKNKLLQYLWQDVQGTSSFGDDNLLFDETINNFEKLYENYGTCKIFNDVFLNDFLLPNIGKYPYK